MRPEPKAALARQAKREPAPLRIVVDTREQAPFTFARFPDVEILRETLKTGDYSLAGLQDGVAVERKELGDLIACLTHERPRFERELARGREMIQTGGLFSVMVEATWEDVARGRYRSRMHPQAALQSILAFHARYGVAFILAGNRTAAEYLTHGLLAKFAREVERQEQTSSGRAA